MDAVKLQAKIYAGYGQAAKRLGLPHSFSRPIEAAAPVPTPYLIQPVVFTTSDRFNKPNGYGQPTWLGEFDGRACKVGDFIAGPSGTFFIAAMQHLLPILCVECNHSVRVSRQAAMTDGDAGYSGMRQSTQVDIVGKPGSLWPASILIGGRSQNAAGLPADGKNAGWKILLPPSVPVTIMAGDIVTDDVGRRFMVDAAESSDLGWRLMTQEVHS